MPVLYDPLYLSWANLNPDKLEAYVDACYEWLDDYLKISREKLNKSLVSEDLFLTMGLDWNYFRSQAEPTIQPKKLIPLIINNCDHIDHCNRGRDTRLVLALTLICFSILNRMLCDNSNNLLKLHHLSVHRLLIGILCCALKWCTDDFPSNSTLDSASGLKSEVNRLERSVLTITNWKIRFQLTPDELIHELKEKQPSYIERLTIQTHPQVKQPSNVPLEDSPLLVEPPCPVQLMSKPSFSNATPNIEQQTPEASTPTPTNGPSFANRLKFFFCCCCKRSTPNTPTDFSPNNSTQTQHSVR